MYSVEKALEKNRRSPEIREEISVFHLNPVVLKSSYSQRSLVCRLDGGTADSPLSNTHTWLSIIPDSFLIPH